MNEIINMTLNQYIDILSSKSSMPGGGTTSAMSATMGVSLYLMVINISLENEKYQEYKDELLKYKEELEVYKNELLNLIDEDVIAYNSITEAYAMKSDTETEKAEKETKKQEALYTCALPPMKTMQFSLASLSYAEKLIGKTSKQVESDLIVGTINLKSAISSSYQNVLVNARFIKDQEQSDGLKTYAKAILEKSKVITHIINEKFKK